jgi:hypothetical protein
MSTPYRRALVSLAATMTITLGLGACAGASSGGPSYMEVRPLAIRFDNGGREHVHVYLISESRQWVLGRVEPGAIATLRIPEEAFAARSMFVRLAVLSGEGVTLQVARHPRAALTVAQPALAITTRRWWFAQGELMSLGR